MPDQNTERDLIEIPVADISIKPVRRMRITHLRDSLGWAYLSVPNTDEPIIIQRYSKQEVVMVSLWEWRFLKAIEAAIRTGSIPWQDVETAILGHDVSPRGEVSEHREA